VQLATIVLALSLALGAPGLTPPAATLESHLPPTAPGFSNTEGVFLVTAADDGSRAVYFISRNTRHSISVADLQLEQQLNPLWPVRFSSRDELLAFAEGAPIANARTGLLGAAVAQEPVVAQAPIEEETVAQPVGVESSTYLLRPGDNLTNIAKNHGTTIDALLAANSISNANRVYAGLTLVIPGTAVAADAVAKAEPEPVADAPEGAEAATYVVKPGDSAILIARRFGVDVDLLLTANGVVNRNRVYVGQTLAIPAGA
jgi:LysM repeat protein